MQTEVTGFILNEIPYGETSKIINIYTKEKGLIGVMCKGAKSMKSRLRAFTQNFTYGVFNLQYKKDKLSNLISVDIINPLKNIKNDLTLMSFITYISDLTYQVIKQNDQNIFDDFINAVLKIEEGLDPLIITNILELKYLPLQGIHLNLDSCVKCGNKTEIVTIDGSYGGYICKNCYQNEVIVDKKVIKLIRMYMYVNIQSITSINVEDKYKEVINEFINAYYENFSGIYVYSKKFLESLL